ncbi:MAG: OB-fold nucleic acid binding domain-containing protein [Candidatus Aenigmatarchaeota archaeon]
MNISEIKIGMSNITIKAKVIDKSEVREVNTKYGRRSVVDVLLEDATGQISLSLWEKDIDKVDIGDTVKISGAFATSFKDKLQLNVPRTGKIQVLHEPEE